MKVSQQPGGAQRRVEEAQQVLEAIGLPKAQRNEPSARILLALLGLKPEDDWSEASDPLVGTTPIMDFIREYYGVDYAPNTRETVRRHTLHQFVHAGIVVPNPDNPSRPVNSPKFVYRVEARVLDLVRAYGAGQWDEKLSSYLSSHTALRARYARAREMRRISVKYRGRELRLSPGGQNELIKRIIEEFCSRFAPDGDLLYVGDPGEKWAYFDEERLRSLGVTVDEHGKMPDVVVFRGDKRLLLLIEAVTSHGPVNPKRREELASLFRDCEIGLVYITAFLDRKTLRRYLTDVSWETEVWIADDPDHMIHFDGERFLAPHGRDWPSR